MAVSPLTSRVLAGVLLGLAVLVWPPAWPWLVTALSPYVAVGSLVSARSGSLWWLLAAPMLLVAVFRRRFWCRRLCPVGLLTELCGSARLRYAPPGGPPRQRLQWPPGRYLALATLGGALAGYPFLLWMDPLALYSAAVGLAWPALVGLPLVMLVSWLWPGLWCTRICPLGATQDLLALARRGEALPRRRVFLALGAGALIGLLVPRSWARRRPLRPPGSVDETAFRGGCIRCGNCARVCPTGVIQPDVRAADIAGWLAPTLRFSGPNYCLQDCNRCGQACPTRVIRPLALAAKNRQVIGIARIDLARCLLTQEVECGVCIPRCPRGAIVEDFARETYTVSVRVDERNCNGCGACVGICPPKVVTIEPAPALKT